MNAPDQEVVAKSVVTALGEVNKRADWFKQMLQWFWPLQNGRGLALGLSLHHVLTPLPPLSSVCPQYWVVLLEGSSC